MQVLFIIPQSHLVIVDEFSRLLIVLLALRSAEQCEENSQSDDLSRQSDHNSRAFSSSRSTHFERLHQNDGRKEAAQEGSQPFLTFHIAELDAAHNDEEDRYHRHQER